MVVIGIPANNSICTIDKIISTITQFLHANGFWLVHIKYVQQLVPFPFLRNYKRYIIRSLANLSNLRFAL